MVNSNNSSRTHCGKAILIQLNKLDGLGFSSEIFLKNTGLDHDKLDDINQECSLDQQNRFYRNVLGITQDPLIGLKMGAEFNAQKYGLFGYALLSAKTVRDALLFTTSFYRLTFTYYNLDFEVKGKLAEFSFKDPLPAEPDVLNYLADRDVMALKVALNEMVGESLPLHSVEFTHSGRGIANKYEKHFECPTLFNQPTNKLVFEAKHLERKLVNSDPSTSGHLIQQCQMLIAKLANHGQYVDRVRMLILAKPGYFPDIEFVAEKLKMSSRTLRRHLTNEGTSYRKLMDEIRNNIAIEYLTESDIPVADISRLLGYSEPGNFTHAFIKWNNLNPSEFRESKKV